MNILKYKLCLIVLGLFAMGAASAQSGTEPDTFTCNYTTDIDQDDDGLIEICDIEGLDAIRYQKDGTGYRKTSTSPKITTGCKVGGCNGYELTTDLDLTKEDNWLPIESFTSILEGNGHTISNLKINRPNTDNAGLFGTLESSSEINNIGLLNIDIKGDDNVGGLAGQNSGNITDSYVTGSVEGDGNVGGLTGRNNSGSITDSYATGSFEGFWYVGGLTGRNNSGSITDSHATGSVDGRYYLGGLVGRNNDSITNSYATGSVVGQQWYVGGLVGVNYSDGSITNSYATGSVDGDSSIGGLVGQNNGSIANSYAIGPVDGKTRVGGLVGWDNRGSIANSYWDTETSGRETSDGGIGKTTTELQSPTTATGIYSRWSTDDWGFGSALQYPILKDENGDLLSPLLHHGLSRLRLTEGYLAPDFIASALNYAGTVVNSINTIQLILTAANPEARIRIESGEINDDIASGSTSNEITLNPIGITTITIVVINNEVTTKYDLHINYYHFSGDVDKDGDGLIEIDNLEELNAIRYQADGTGYRKQAQDPKITTGCPAKGCIGYELTADLDLTEEDNWLPIESFTSIFEGNGHTVSNLKINRPNTDNVGLFGYVESGSEINNIGLLNVDIKGNNLVGGLAGRNNGRIANSYATGAVDGQRYVGGLVGENDDRITGSYATGSIDGQHYVGGLVGENDDRITSSYATGSVDGVSWVGGLVGYNTESIANSYATGSIDGQHYVGGLVGWNISHGSITNSYWDTVASGRATSDGGTGKTTTELQSPTAATGIYSRWSTDNWDFGTASQYPVLKDGNGDLLSPVLRGLSRLRLAEGYLTTDFIASAPNYTGTVVNGTNTIHLIPTAANPDARIRIDSGGTHDDIASGTTSSEITLNPTGITTITIVVINSKSTVKYNLDINYYRFSGDVDKDGDGLIEIDNLEGLNAIRYQADGTGYRKQAQDPKVTIGCPEDGCKGYELTADLDLTEEDNWLPIKSFKGIFEGNGHTISNLKINRPNAANVGLFGYTNRSTKISNIGLLNVDIKGNNHVGGLVGRNDGRITDSYATGSVDGQQYVGGLVGENDRGIIANSYATGSVIGTYSTIGGLVGFNFRGRITDSYATGPVDGDGSVGGLVGTNTGRITDSYATGPVDGDGSVGGLVGSNNEGGFSRGTIANSYATGSVTGDDNVGGLVGYNYSGTIANSYATGSVTGDDNVGGLVGYNYSGTIANSYATGSVTGDDNVGGLVGDNSIGTIANSYAIGSVDGGTDVGGLVGDNGGAITNSYAGGSVDGDAYVGGLVGWNSSSVRNYAAGITNSHATAPVDGGTSVGGLVGLNSSVIRNSYATGSVNGRTNVGGLVGENYVDRILGRGIITNSYWDTVASGRATSNGGIGKTTAELQSPIAATGIYSRWSANNWDFGTASQYPILKDKNGDLLSPALRYGLSRLRLTEGYLSPEFIALLPNYTGTLVNSTSTIHLIPTAVNPDARIRINSGDIHDDIASGTASSKIILNPVGITTITIVVIYNGNRMTYNLDINYYRFSGDVDKDDDGLIEIDDLEGLNAIRYQADGTGYRKTSTSPKIETGCPEDGCKGYELTADLDLNEEHNWLPIKTLTGVFEGNGHTISNLKINRPGTDYVGLFGDIRRGSEINNIGLLNVDIQGDEYVGSLAGRNSGRITGSYAGGSVDGDEYVGGLVGENNSRITASYATGPVDGGTLVGGLVGRNFGRITAGYATGPVDGDEYVGGLVGRNSGRITAGYATGPVDGDEYVGGLVGENHHSSIANSYATGPVDGDEYVGGLVGWNNRSSIANSYWDTEASGIPISSGGIGKTTAELQSPTAATGIYKNWSADNWDFGTASQYPVLRDENGDLLPTTLRHSLRQLRLTEGYLSPDFVASQPNYTGTVVNNTNTIQLIPTAVNPYARIRIDSGEIHDDIASGSASSEIILNPVGITTITIVVTDNENKMMKYNLNINYYRFSGDIDKDGDGLIEIDDLEGLNAIRYESDGTGYKKTSTSPKIVIGCPVDGCKGYELTGNLDLTEEDNWLPINAFTGIFEGNGHTISNLKINRPDTDNVGLFGYAERSSEISNIGLLNVDIKGNNHVGSLVGRNSGSVANSYATGSVVGEEDVGGLLGQNNGSITNSYVIGSVSGDYSVGGLVGQNNGSITNSYVIGPVSGDYSVGGLVGRNNGGITNSYATGFVYWRTRAGGLVGLNSGSVANSYWDTNTSGILISAAGTGKTTAELQSPTAATGIYSSWSADNWDFGSASQYPVLKDENGDLLLPALRHGLSRLRLAEGYLSPNFVAWVPNYTGTVISNTNTIQLIPTAINPDARIRIDSGEIHDDIASGSTSSEIILDVIGITTITIVVTDNEATIKYNLNINYSRPSRDIDKDGDGLIEIDDLAGLNAIRYQPDGTGYRKTSTDPKVTTGCPEDGCKGYELTADLDLAKEDNWLPISAFTGIFEGNGHTISNLKINRPDADNVGLFGYIEEGSEINNISLLNVDIKGNNHVGSLVGWNNFGSIANSYATGFVNGDEYVGGLVGQNDYGGIANSYATVSGNGDEYVGGLVGQNYRGNIANSYATGLVNRGSRFVGGLVGQNNRGSIANGYATGSAYGDEYVGGLVGRDFGGSITNSYATGFINGDEYVGGLIGQNNFGSITNSYATALVDGRTRVGGLVGWNNFGNVANSYWDTEASGTSASAAGTGKITAELQSPTAATGIYSNWSADNWDFGAASQYPVLRDENGDLLSPILRYGLSRLRLTEGHLSPDFVASAPHYAGTVVNSTSTIYMIPTALNSDARIHIDSGEIQDDIASGSTSSEIILNAAGITTITIVVINSEVTITYDLHINYYRFSGDIDKDGDGLIEVDNLERLNAIRYQADGTGYRKTSTDPKVTTGCPADGCIGYELTADLDLAEENNWLPIESFTSIFEGNGHTISNLTINRPNTDNVGLFGYVERSSEINNIGLLDVNINGYLRVGSLVGWNNSGSITNSYASGSVTGDSRFVGGLIGSNGGSIVNSYATSSVNGNNSVGGLIGSNGGSIVNSYASGSVDGNNSVGGLAGSNGGSIAHSYASGSVAGDSHSVGGLTGGNGGSIAHSYATGSVTGDSHSVGGLAGGNGGSIAHSYASGSVDGNNSVGGLVGSNGDSIANSYATGSVAGDEYVGGLAGRNFGGSIAHSYATGPVEGDSYIGGLAGQNNSGSIANSYATGPVGGDEYVGGLAGWNYWGSIANGYAIGPVDGKTRVGGLVGWNNRGSITDSYWDTVASGISTSDAGIGKTTTELQSPTTATGIYSRWSTDNWDFGSALQYPILKDENGDLLSPALRYGLSRLRLAEGHLTPDFIASALNYAGTVVNNINTIHLIPTAANPEARIRIDSGEINDDITSGSTSSEITLNPIGITTITIAVINSEATTKYDLHINYYRFNGDVDKDGNGLIEIDDFEGLNAIRYQADGTGYRKTSTSPKITTGCPAEGCIGYELTGNLDLTEEDNWLPIKSFTSILEGNGHTISNLKINRPNTDNVGLFGYIGRYAEIDNLGLLNVDIKGNNFVGGLVGQNDGRITDSYATGSVDGDSYVGGLVGQNDGRITDSYATGSVDGDSYVGGLVGQNYWSSSITNSHAAGFVVGDSYVGGLVGRNNSSIANNYATGPVDGRTHVGGLVGQNNYVVENSYATGSVDGDAYVGGLVGSIGTYSNINDNYATGPVDGDTYVGGLVGSIGTYSNINNNYATGPVDGDTYVGGLVGSIGSYNNINNNHATGPVDGDYYVGGLVGSISSYNNINNNYVTGPVVGDTYVGGLVGQNDISRILNSYATGPVDGDYYVGGLVGQNNYFVENSYATGPVDGDYYVGGLVGQNNYFVENSYATGPVDGDRNVGGLVGSNRGDFGDIINGYATGSVDGDRNVGGLVGWNDADAGIRASYAIGSVVGRTYVGGLVGRNDSYRSSDDSYWDTETSGILISAAGTGKTTTELQSPTMATGIYRFWNRNADDWDFGSASQYPVLNLKDGNGDLLSPALRYGLSRLRLAEGHLSPDFIASLPNYTGTIVNSTSTIQLIPTAINPDALIRIDSGEIHDEIASGTTSSKITLNTFSITTITIVVINSAVTIKYNLNINYYRFSGDVDKDGDGLIEIDNVEGLNAIRYQADGTGYRKTSTSPKIAIGCPAEGCIGYELTADLDLSEVDNWLPIESFKGMFEGNGHTISNLKINRPDADNVGLFGLLRRSSEISNIGLLNIDIKGNENVGGLAGQNSGSITNSYATGSVDGRNDVGGLAGWNNSGSITSSYATGSVDGDTKIGGLVGQNSGSVTNSYTIGPVGGDTQIGGLVGQNSGSVTNSYTIGLVGGDTQIGGLVGQNSGSITNSYWDTDASGISISAGGTGKTTAELQSPTAATGIYSSWSSDNWDFGTSGQLPILKYTEACTATTEERIGQPICGSFLPNQGTGLRTLEVSASYIMRLFPVFSSEQSEYVTNIPPSADSINLRLKSYDAEASFEIKKPGDDTNYFTDNEKSSISVDDAEILTIQVSGADADTAATTVTSYTLRMSFPPITLSAISVTEDGTENTDDTASEGSVYTLHTMTEGGSEDYQYKWTQTSGNTLDIADLSIAALRFKIPPNFVKSDTTTSSDVSFMVMVTDSRNNVSTENKILTIMKIDNSEPIVEVIVNGTTLTAVVTDADDYDDNPNNNEVTYQWQKRNSDSWMNIDKANAATYKIPSAVHPGVSHRVIVEYTDDQGYEKRVEKVHLDAAIRIRVKVFLEGLLQ